MDFITWLFEKHDVISTLVFPLVSLAWCVFKGETVRGFVCLCILFIIMANKKG